MLERYPQRRVPTAFGVGFARRGDSRFSAAGEEAGRQRLTPVKRLESPSKSSGIGVAGQERRIFWSIGPSHTLKRVRVPESRKYYVHFVQTCHGASVSLRACNDTVGSRSFHFASQGSAERLPCAGDAGLSC